MVPKKLRVLQLGSPTGLYGAERWILALIKHLDPESVESIVGVIKDELSLEAPLCSEAAKFGFETKTFEAYGKFNFSAVWQLRRFIREADIDILHTHWYKTDFIGWLAAQGTGCKIVSTPHGWSEKAGLKLWFYEMMSRWLFPWFDKVVPLSKGLYGELEHIPGLKRKLELIQNGLDIGEIDSVESVADEMKHLKDKGVFILGYIGQLIHRKGLDVLFHALSSLEKLNWRLVVVGQGQQENELKGLASQLGIADRVMFLGFRKDRLSLLKGFDIFVLPSRLEGIPRCLMESMAAGVPVIASDIPGCNDLVTHLESGLLFAVGNRNELSEEIAKIASDRILREKLIGRGRRTVKNQFSAEHMANQYITLYKEIYEC